MMPERKRLTIYGLKVFVVFWGLAAIAGYLDRNPDASPGDLATGALIAALIAAAVALIATLALKYTGKDAGV